MEVDCNPQESLYIDGGKYCMNGRCVMHKTSEILEAVRMCICENDWHGKRCSYFDPHHFFESSISISAMSAISILILLLILLFVFVKVEEKSKNIREKLNKFSFKKNKMATK
uniref:Epidermal growth factor Smed-egf-5 n=1 Tax=Schmidtea mediterranea TaxID=79327 RepID=A0A1B1ACY0_SCHMD|nr:epidermal growth factor Smed-egf-5 [Schmidtea mediterranea]